MLSAIWYNPERADQTESGGSAREQLVVVQAAQEQGERYSLKSDEVTPYQEEGDFGVC